MVNLVHKEQSEKQHALDTLSDLEGEVAEIAAALKSLRAQIDPT